MNTYAEEIHKHLRCKERKRLKYKGTSKQLKYRPAMIAFMEKMCVDKKYNSVVQHLAAYLMDIFMDNHDIITLEEVIVSCVILAAKLEDTDKMPPKFSEFFGYFAEKFTAQEFFKLEISILDFFKWDILFPTAASFIEYYAMFVMLPSDMINNRLLCSTKGIEKVVNKYIEYFLDIVVQEHEYLQFNPSLVAASCIACTRRCITVRPVWPETLKNVTFYDYKQIEPCVELLLKALDEDMIKQNKKEAVSKPRETEKVSVGTKRKTSSSESSICSFVCTKAVKK